MRPLTARRTERSIACELGMLLRTIETWESLWALNGVTTERADAAIARLNELAGPLRAQLADAWRREWER